MADILPVGKLPTPLLAQLLAGAPTQDRRVLVGPGIGLDCAVVEAGEQLLVFKSDPITFATDEIGWYAVQVTTNDIATAGATPRWLLATLLLPEGQTTLALVEKIGQQVFDACRQNGITLIGGHTEITYGLNRPILSATLVGEVPRQGLVTPQGAQPGDRLLLTKGVPVEATAILAREAPERLQTVLSPEELAAAQDFLHSPGISILQDARLALSAGQVHAMHDPTEGGLYSAIWELAEASQQSLWIDPAAVPVPLLSRRICDALQIDPLAAIASGALLLAASPASAGPIRAALTTAGLDCAEIGAVDMHSEVTAIPSAWSLSGGARRPLPRPERDEIARLFET